MRVVCDSTARFSNAGDLLPAFDLVALSSRREGTPIVLFEAMAAQVPIVATDVGGIADVVRPGREALIVPPETTSELSSAITNALSDRTGSKVRSAVGTTASSLGV